MSTAAKYRKKPVVIEAVKRQDDELRALRGVVEAVRALADDWEQCSGPPAWTAHAASLRAALASVPSSGEAESGEAVGDRWDGTPLYSCASCGTLTAHEPPRMCALCEDAPAPVVSGGQADGEGEDARTLAALIRDHAESVRVIFNAPHAAFSLHRVADRVAALAARPVLSREAKERVARALAEAADDAAFDPEIESMDPDLWLAKADDRDYWRMLAHAALAAVLVGQEER